MWYINYSFNYLLKFSNINFYFKVFHLIFILLFSYTLLFKLDKLDSYGDIYDDENKTKNISQELKVEIAKNLKISLYEVLLLIWILSFFGKELLQVCIKN